MKDADKLKKENKKLTRLLKDAVALLNKCKDVTQSAQGLAIEDGEPKAEKKKGKKGTAKRANKKK